MRRAFAAIAILIPLGVLPLGRVIVAQDSAADAKQTDDLRALRQTAAAFTAAFNKADAKAVAALWTADGELIDDTGRRLTGRSEIEKAYAELFANSAGAKIQIIVDSLRLLSPDAAIEDGRAILEPAPAGPPSITKYTVVHVKHDGQWLMSTARETRVETPSGYSKVADLEWLIGTWTAEEHGSKTESVCRWVANKSFVERTFTTTHADHSTASGVQLIGFNPELDHIQSWAFTSDGGHAVGVWTPRDNGWAAEMRGVTGDGTITTAVNHLTKLDDNAYVWQSVQRTLGGNPVADTGQVVLKRSSPSR